MSQSDFGNPLREFGQKLRDARIKMRLSQHDAARRAGVGIRCWSEVERGARKNVSASTLADMLAEVGLSLSVTETTTPAEVSRTHALSSKELHKMKTDLVRAEEFGIDLSLLRSARAMSPMERVRTNDDALALFDAITVIPGPR